MNTLKHFLGFVELAAALKFLSNSDLVWQWNVISRELFLAAWALLFVLAGLYLFGAFDLARRALALGEAEGGGARRPLGRVRKIGALLSLVFAVYCLLGMRGRELDPVMTAIAPPYSGGRLFPAWHVTPGQWRIVTDDYDRALEIARSDDKLLLVNFTGHT
jgi:thiol:disulfide interchange protein DsbD